MSRRNKGNTDVRDAEYIARGLSRILEVDEESIREKMEKTNSAYEIIKKRVDQEIADEVRKFINGEIDDEGNQLTTVNDDGDTVLISDPDKSPVRVHGVYRSRIPSGIIPTVPRRPTCWASSTTTISAAWAWRPSMTASSRGPRASPSPPGTTTATICSINMSSTMTRKTAAAGADAGPGGPGVFGKRPFQHDHQV